MPDFAQVYSFIGSVFDPNVTNHLQTLQQMDPINVKTVSECKSFIFFGPMSFFFFIFFPDFLWCLGEWVSKVWTIRL